MKYKKFIEYHHRAAVVDVGAIEKSKRIGTIQDIVYGLEGEKDLDYIVLNFENILKKEGPIMKAKIIEMVFLRYNNVIAAGVKNSHKALGVEYHHFIEENKKKGKIYDSVEEAIKAVSDGYKG